MAEIKTWVEIVHLIRVHNLLAAGAAPSLNKLELCRGRAIIDDHLAYLVSDRLGQRKRFLLDVLADLVSVGKLNKGLGVEIVQAIHTRYPPAFVEHTLLLLRR